MIYTNQIELTLFHEAIDRDFIILEACRDSGDYKGSRVPDEALQYGQVLSVAYDWGNTCYILYRRDQADPEGLKHHLEACDSKTILREVTSDKLNSNQMAQLLFNAMHRLRRLEGYHNLSGKLYERRSGWEKKIKGKRTEFWALEISLDSHNCLQLKVKSFHRVENKSSRDALYVSDRHNGELRRLLKYDPDKNAEVYAEGPRFPDHRNNVDFLGFDTAEHFDNSKAGVLRRFLKDVNRLLKDYLKLEPVPMDECAHLGVDPKKRDVSQVLDLLKTQNVCLTDLVDDEESHALADLIRMELKTYRQIIPQEGPPVPGSVVLQIIHNKAYFEAHPEEKDHHSQVTDGCIIQHVTVEDFHLTGYNKRTGKEQEDACFKKVILELAIKLDIHQKQVSCFPWSALGYDRPVSFVTAQMDRKTGICRYRQLTISPEGQMNFDCWEGPGPFSDPIRASIEAAFLTKYQKFDYYVEGLVYEDPEQIQIIRQTGRHTLPDLEALRTVIRDNHPEEYLEIAPLSELVRQKHLTAQQEGDKKTADHLLTILNSLPALAPEDMRKNIKAVVGTTGELSQELSRSYHALTGKWIFRGMKGKYTAEEFFSGVMDIRCYRENSCTYYYSGFHRTDLQKKLARGCTIRRVSSTGGEVQIERYLPLMEVGFVRASAWTVLPFPFKYLREWTKITK